MSNLTKPHLYKKHGSWWYSFNNVLEHRPTFTEVRELVTPKLTGREFAYNMNAIGSFTGYL